jgi:hypothetical protein
VGDVVWDESGRGGGGGGGGEGRGEGGDVAGEEEVFERPHVDLARWAVV